MVAMAWGARARAIRRGSTAFLDVRKMSHFVLNV